MNTEKAIRCGKKFEAMWREFKEKLGKHKLGSASWSQLNNLMNEYEQKYFPKPIKKNITIEFESRCEDLIDRTIRHLRDKSSGIESWYGGQVKVNIKE